MADKTNVVTKETMLKSIKSSYISICPISFDHSQFSPMQAAIIDDIINNMNMNFYNILSTIQNEIEISDEIVDRCILCKKNKGKITTKDE